MPSYRNVYLIVHFGYVLCIAVSDAMDDIMADSDDEEESSAIVNQVLDEIGIDISGKVRMTRNRPLSRRLDRCDRVIQDEVGDSNVFVTRKFGNVERNSHCDVLHNAPVRVAHIVLDCNGVFAIKAYTTDASSNSAHGF